MISMQEQFGHRLCEENLKLKRQHEEMQWESVLNQEMEEQYKNLRSEVS